MTRLVLAYVFFGLLGAVLVRVAGGGRLTTEGVLIGLSVMSLSVALICGGGWALFAVSGSAEGAVGEGGEKAEWRVPRFVRLAFLPLFLGKTLIGGLAVYGALVVLDAGLLDFGVGLAVGLAAFLGAVLVHRSRFFLVPNTEN